MFNILFNLLCNQVNKSYLVPEYFLPINENYKFVGGQNDYFLVASKSKKIQSILVPELTYSSFVKLVNNGYLATRDGVSSYEDKSIYYCETCFRNESVYQKNRFKFFKQMGAEFFSQNKEKVDAYLLVHLSLLKFIFDNVFSNVIYKFSLFASDEIFNAAVIIFNSKNCKVIRYDEKPAENGMYSDLIYEVHVYDDETNDYYEVIGGGSYEISYKDKKTFGTGFVIGKERMNNMVIQYITEGYKLIDLITERLVKIKENNKEAVLISKKENIVRQVDYLVEKLKINTTLEPVIIL